MTLDRIGLEDRVAVQRESERLVQESDALIDAVGRLRERVSALGAGLQRGDERAVDRVLDEAGPDLGWPDPPSGSFSVDASSEAWRQLTALAEKLERLARASRAEMGRATIVSTCRALRERLVPTGDVRLPHVAVHSWTRRGSTGGPDWWLARSRDDASLVVLGEVEREGLAASMIGATVWGAIELALMGGGEAIGPGRLLRMLGRTLHETGAGAFRSRAIALSVTNGGTELRIANAGHEAPSFFAFGQWGVVRSHVAPTLGKPLAGSVDELALPVRPGDRVVVFTTGVSETRGPRGRALGAHAVHMACAQSRPDLPGAELRDTLQRLVRDHGGPRVTVADATLLVVEVTS